MNCSTTEDSNATEETLETVTVFAAFSTFCLQQSLNALLIVTLSAGLCKNYLPKKRTILVLNRCVIDALPTPILILVSSILILWCDGEQCDCAPLSVAYQCSIMIFMSQLGLSYLTMAAVRLMAIYRPLLYRIHVTEMNCFCLVVVNWLISLCIVAILVFVVDHSYLDEIVTAVLLPLYACVYIACITTLVVMIRYHRQITSGRLQREFGSLWKVCLQISVMMICALPYMFAFMHSIHKMFRGDHHHLAIFGMLIRALFDPISDLCFDPPVRDVLCCRHSSSRSQRQSALHQSRLTGDSLAGVSNATILGGRRSKDNSMCMSLDQVDAIATAVAGIATKKKPATDAGVKKAASVQNKGSVMPGVRNVQSVRAQSEEADAYTISRDNSREDDRIEREFADCDDAEEYNIAETHL